MIVIQSILSIYSLTHSQPNNNNIVGYVGLDIMVHHIINATGGKEANLTIQKLGRGLRKAPGIIPYLQFIHSFIHSLRSRCLSLIPSSLKLFVIQIRIKSITTISSIWTILSSITTPIPGMHLHSSRLLRSIRTPTYPSISIVLTII